MQDDKLLPERMRGGLHVCQARRATLVVGIHQNGDEWLGHDDADAVERAADPLHCPRIDSKPFRNDADTGPPRSRQGLTDSFLECGGNWRPPEALSFTSGPRKPGTDSFCNHRPFEFGEHAQHLKHRLVGGCRGVEALLAQEQVDLQRVQLGQKTDQILQTAAQRSTDQAMTIANSRRAASRHQALLIGDPLPPPRSNC
jgi:hypothetical protein